MRVSTKRYILFKNKKKKGRDISLPNTHKLRKKKDKSMNQKPLNGWMQK